MQPQINRTDPIQKLSHPQQNPEVYSANPTSFPQFQNNLQCNYLMPPLNSIYPYTYPYSNLPYGNNPYMQFQHSNWGEVNFPTQTTFPISNFQQNMNFMQNTRVISQETKGKNPPELIIIDSEEEPVLQNSPKELQNIECKNESKKQLSVIQIDDNSVKPQEEKKQKEPEKKKTKQNKHCKQPILQSLKYLKESENAKNQLLQKQKTKQIRKVKKRDFKELHKELKIKEKLQLKQAKEKLKKEEEKTKSKQDEKKSKKDLNPSKIAKKQKVVEHDENNREIAKYMESHGEIRNGKQFQSRIPDLASTINSREGFKIWLQQKRSKVLKREISLPSF